MRNCAEIERWKKPLNISNHLEPIEQWQKGILQ